MSPRYHLAAAVLAVQLQAVAWLDRRAGERLGLIAASWLWNRIDHAPTGHPLPCEERWRRMARRLPWFFAEFDNPNSARLTSWRAPQ